MVNGKIFTLVWYVDEKKVSRMEATVVKNLINDPKNHFGELIVTRVKKHTFLGMNINITEDKNVDIYTKDKLLEAIEALGEDLNEKVTTPASSHLFIVK